MLDILRPLYTYPVIWHGMWMFLKITKFFYKTYLHTALCRYTSALKSVARVEKPLQSECYNQFMNNPTLHYVSAFSTFRYVHTKAHINIKLQRGFYIGMEVWFTTKIMMNANKFKLLHFWLWLHTNLKHFCFNLISKIFLL